MVCPPTLYTQPVDQIVFGVKTIAKKCAWIVSSKHCLGLGFKNGKVVLQQGMHSPFRHNAKWIISCSITHFCTFIQKSAFCSFRCPKLQFEQTQSYGFVRNPVRLEFVS